MSANLPAEAGPEAADSPNAQQLPVRQLGRREVQSPAGWRP